MESPLIKKIRFAIVKSKENPANFFFILTEHLKEKFDLQKYNFIELLIYYYDYFQGNIITETSFMEASKQFLSTIVKQDCDISAWM
jgi:hypothetical protein